MAVAPTGIGELGNDGKIFGSQLSGGVKAQGLLGIVVLLDRLEHPVYDVAVVVNMAVERRAEAMDTAHRAKARLGAD